MPELKPTEEEMAEINQLFTALEAENEANGGAGKTS